MSVEAQLELIKLVHTLAVALNATAILYTVYCGFRGRFGWLLWAAMAWSAIIALGLLINGFLCPLQTLARSIAGTDEWVTDLYMPDWAARLIVPILGPLQALGYGLVAWRLIRRKL